MIASSILRTSKQVIRNLLFREELEQNCKKVNNTPPKECSRRDQEVNIVAFTIIPNVYDLNRFLANGSCSGSVVTTIWNKVSIFLCHKCCDSALVAMWRLPRKFTDGFARCLNSTIRVSGIILFLREWRQLSSRRISAGKDCMANESGFNHASTIR